MKGVREMVLRKERNALLTNISLAVLTFMILFGIAEVSCMLFYDESENYEKDLWDSMQRTNSSKKSLQGINFSIYTPKRELYSDPDTGLLYKLSDNKLEENRYMSFRGVILLYPNTTKKERLEGKYRIAVVGDSFTHCGGLTVEECGEYIFTRQLYDLLNNMDETNIGGIEGFEVLSVSYGGINTYQEYFLLRDIAMPYNPDMVILQYTDNDIRLPRSELGFDGSGHFISSNTRLLYLGDKIVPALPYLDEKISSHLLSHSAFLRFVSYKLNIILINNEVDVESSFNSIRKMNMLVKENNVSFIIINFPPAAWTEDNCGEWHANAQGMEAGIDLHGELKKLADELDVPFYNMCDYVDDIHSIKSENEGEDGTHYSKEGYRIAAEVLKGAVLEEITSDEDNRKGIILLESVSES